MIAFLKVQTRASILLVLNFRVELAMAPPNTCSCSLSLPLLLFLFTPIVCDVQQLICVPNALSCTLSCYIYSKYHCLFLSSLHTPYWSGPFSLVTVSPFASSPMTKKRTASQFFDDAESNGLESLDRANIDGDTAFKHLESGSEIRYSRMLILWDGSVSTSLPIATKSYKLPH